jgi:hypothetical protein
MPSGPAPAEPRGLAAAQQQLNAQTLAVLQERAFPELLLTVTDAPAVRLADWLPCVVDPPPAADSFWCHEFRQASAEALKTEGTRLYGTLSATMAEGAADEIRRAASTKWMEAMWVLDRGLSTAAASKISEAQRLLHSQCACNCATVMCELGQFHQATLFSANAVIQTRAKAAKMLYRFLFCLQKLRASFSGSAVRRAQLLERVVAMRLCRMRMLSDESVARMVRNVAAESRPPLPIHRFDPEALLDDAISAVLVPAYVVGFSGQPPPLALPIRLSRSADKGLIAKAHRSPVFSRALQMPLAIAQWDHWPLEERELRDVLLAIMPDPSRVGRGDNQSATYLMSAVDTGLAPLRPWQAQPGDVVLFFAGEAFSQLLSVDLYLACHAFMNFCMDQVPSILEAQPGSGLTEEQWLMLFVQWRLEAAQHLPPALLGVRFPLEEQGEVWLAAVARYRATSRGL